MVDPGMPAGLASLCLPLVLLAPFALAGLALINAGLSRSRAASHTLLSSLAIASVAMLCYVAIGFALQGTAETPARLLHLGGVVWNVAAAGPAFLGGISWDGSRTGLIALFQLFAVALAAVIPAASAAERWRLGASTASTALLAALVYPLFAHWVWGGGWLSQLGGNFGLGAGFADPGGSGCIHAVGGLTALSVAWILGPRRGKFTSEGLPTAMPGHNAVVVLFGCMLALAGWMGLNTAGALLFGNVVSGRMILVAINTILTAAAAGVAAVFTTRVRFGRPDASLSANGWVCGLAASSAAAPFVKPPEAIIVGLVAGAAAVFSVEVIELRMHVDDPAGAISVHGVGGVWGLLALGIFGTLPSGTKSAGDGGQFLAELTGVATLLGFVLPVSYGLNWLLNRVLPQRVAPEGERQGMDLFELGAGAYPEFVTHREDAFRR